MNFVDQSQAPARSLTLKPTPMPAQPLALVLPLVNNGAHGDSYLGGNRKVGILDGPKLSASNSSLTPSSHPALLAATSRSTVTTMGLLTAGGKVEVGMYPLILSSTRSARKWMMQDSQSILAMCQVRPTPLTAPQEASSLQPATFYLQSYHRL